MAVCGCTNARGGPKNQHKTREAALAVAMSPKMLRTGLPHSVYPCPKIEGVWHVRTERKRLG